MSYAAIGNALRQRFFDKITAGGDGGTAITTHFPNLGWINSSEAEVGEPNNTINAQVWIQNGAADQTEIGADPLRETRTGVLFVVIRAPQQSGESAMEALIDRVFTAFRRLTISGVTFRAHNSLGRTTEGPWWRETLALSWFSNVSTTAAT